MVFANNKLSDEELMVLYCRGEIDAFDTLFHRHSGKVHGYFTKKTSLLPAADLTQETFLKLHRSRHLYLSHYPFLPWLFTIAKNVLFDSLRAIQKRKEEPHLTEVTAPMISDNEVNDFLNKLEGEQQTAVRLRYLEDWSFEEMAEKFQTSPENARQLVSRGIRKLKTIFLSSKKENGHVK